MFEEPVGQPSSQIHLVCRQQGPEGSKKKYQIQKKDGGSKMNPKLPSALSFRFLFLYSLPSPTLPELCHQRGQLAYASVL